MGGGPAAIGGGSGMRQSLSVFALVSLLMSFELPSATAQRRPVPERPIERERYRGHPLPERSEESGGDGSLGSASLLCCVAIPVIVALGVLLAVMYRHLRPEVRSR